MGAVFGFVRGAFVELCQLVLVYAAALLGVELLVRQDMTLAAAAIPLGFFALYSAFVILPARDLVQGWLGMIAGRQPARYDDRGENLGRALVMLGSLALLVLPAVDRHEPREVRAFATAFLLLAMLVFGLGGAVPRLWFTIRSAPEGAADQVPELLREAGKRAARLFYCTFLGIGLGLVAALAADTHVAASQPPPPAASADVVASERVQVKGELCRAPAAGCPDHRDLAMAAFVAGRLPIAFYPDPGVDLPVCLAVVAGDWPAAAADRDALVDHLNASAGGGEASAQAKAGDRVQLRVVVPDGDDRCGYFVDIQQPEPAP